MKQKLVCEACKGEVSLKDTVCPHCSSSFLANKRSVVDVSKFKIKAKKINDSLIKGLTQIKETKETRALFLEFKKEYEKIQELTQVSGYNKGKIEFYSVLPTTDASFKTGYGIFAYVKIKPDLDSNFKNQADKDNPYFGMEDTEVSIFKIDGKLYAGIGNRYEEKEYNSIEEIAADLAKMAESRIKQYAKMKKFKI